MVSLRTFHQDTDDLHFATLIAVTLGSGAILAAQGEHNQGRMHNPGVSAESTTPGERGQKGEHGSHANTGEGCPMNQQRNPS